MPKANNAQEGGPESSSFFNQSVQFARDHSDLLPAHMGLIALFRSSGGDNDFTDVEGSFRALAAASESVVAEANYDKYPELGTFSLHYQSSRFPADISSAGFIWQASHFNRRGGVAIELRGGEDPESVTAWRAVYSTQLARQRVDRLAIDDAVAARALGSALASPWLKAAASRIRAQKHGLVTGLEKFIANPTQSSVPVYCEIVDGEKVFSKGPAETLPLGRNTKKYADDVESRTKLIERFGFTSLTPLQVVTAAELAAA